MPLRPCGRWGGSLLRSAGTEVRHPSFPSASAGGFAKPTLLPETSDCDPSCLLILHEVTRDQHPLVGLQEFQGREMLPARVAHTKHGHFPRLLGQQVLWGQLGTCP